MTLVRDNTAKIVLSEKQRALKPLLEEFSSTHILVWWTAIALQVGHRKSIDFDLFIFGKQWTGKELNERIQQTWCKFDLDTAPRFWYADEQLDELTLFFDGVKVQFIDFSRNPFDIPIFIESDLTICEWISTLSLENLGALKLYAIMYRRKYKDIVDLYFILQQGISLEVLIQKTSDIFTKLFNLEFVFENLFSDDWDQTEGVDRLIENPPKYEYMQKYIRDMVDVYILKKSD